MPSGGGGSPYWHVLIGTSERRPRGRETAVARLYGDGAVSGRTGATLRRCGREVAVRTARVAVRADVAVRCAESACGPRTA